MPSSFSFRPLRRTLRTTAVLLLLLALAPAALSDPTPAAEASAPPALMVPATPLRKILFVPYCSAVSHNRLLAKIAREVASRGHQVTITTSNVDHHIDYGNLTKAFVQLPYERDYVDKEWFEISRAEPMKGLERLFDMTDLQCQVYLNNSDFLAAVRNADLIMYDMNWICSHVFARLYPHKLRVEYIPAGFIDSMVSNFVDIPRWWTSIPQAGVAYTPNMTFFQRVENVIAGFITSALLDAQYERVNRIAAAAGKITNAGITTADMTIVSADFHITHPRALPPHVVAAGAVLPDVAKPIEDEELRNFISTSKGFIYVSFGSILRPEMDIVDRLWAALTPLNIPVVWKYSGAEKPRLHPNILALSWAPQNDLVGHPNCRLFVTHGGLNGILEAAYHGTPVAGIPLAFDQFANVGYTVWRGMGLSINKAAPAKDMAKSISELLQNEKYRKSAKAISSLMRDRTRTPTQEVADRIEFVLRHNGTRHLRPARINMPTFAKYGYDIAVFFLSLLLLVLLVIFLLVRKALRLAKAWLLQPKVIKMSAAVVNSKKFN